MASRDFTDERGRAWTVWDVHPTLAKKNPVAAFGQKMAGGWLAFECDEGERRRLAPIPDMPGGWQTASDEQLRLWWIKAETVPHARRLIE
ncbi:MAG: hypothetical protein ACJ796_02265 [Gemmatimonadaceae bacterium]